MFDKKQTLKTKGVAILMLVFHHLFYSEQRIAAAGIVFNFMAKETVMSIAVGMRLCVWIFAFLSAYVLTIQYSKLGQTPSSYDVVCFVRKRWLSLMRPYWIVFWVVFAGFCLSGKNAVELFGDNLFGLSMGALALSDFFGTKMPVAAWWYMCFAQILLLAIPLLCNLCRKYGVLTLVGAVFVLPYVDNGIVSPYGGSYLNYLFVVILGVIYAQNNILEKLGTKHGGVVVRLLEGILLLLLLVGCVKINMKYASEDSWRITKLFMGFATILLCVYVYRHLTWKPLEFVLCYLGKYSGYIFLIHAFSYTYFQKLTFWSSNAVLTYLTVLISSLILAVALDKISALLSKGDITKSEKYQR